MMLGEIGDGTAKKPLRNKQVESFLIHKTYYIPKVSVINYLLNERHQHFKQHL
jgi:hypothetical protein